MTAFNTLPKISYRSKRYNVSQYKINVGLRSIRGHYNNEVHKTVITSTLVLVTILIENCFEMNQTFREKYNLKLLSSSSLHSNGQCKIWHGTLCSPSNLYGRVNCTVSKGIYRKYMSID